MRRAGLNARAMWSSRASPGFAWAPGRGDRCQRSPPGPSPGDERLTTTAHPSIVSFPCLFSRICGLSVHCGVYGGEDAGVDVECGGWAERCSRAPGGGVVVVVAEGRWRQAEDIDSFTKLIAFG